MKPREALCLLALLEFSIGGLTPNRVGTGKTRCPKGILSMASRLPTPTQERRWENTA